MEGGDEVNIGDGFRFGVGFWLAGLVVWLVPMIIIMLLSMATRVNL